MRKLLWLLAVLLSLTGCGSEHAATDEHGHDSADEPERGPHNGRLLEKDAFALELLIHESGTPPEYRVYLYENNEPLPPDAATIEVEIGRLGGKRERFTFHAENDYLRGSGNVGEPHSFDVTVRAARQGQSLEWKFSSHEGRTTIPAPTAQTMGIVTAAAGPASLKRQLSLTGVIQADPARISRVRARYPGVVREIAVQPWTMVARGAVLARVQSNESLQSYSIEAPIAGVIVEHLAQVGEATGEDVLFTIVDLSRVWVELDVFQNDLASLTVDQAVEVFDLDGRKLADGRLSRIAPLAIHGSQSVRARVVLDNASGALRPGQFVTGRVTVSEHKVALTVEKSALQRFRDWDVVFEQVGDTYEARPLQLGSADTRHVEVLDGLSPGARYVTQNSYLIKADIEKSGASHDH
jgi:membrane fusion protein, heavy metal efflux system